MNVQLNHAVLKVRDIERALAFYREVLGFTEIGRMGRQMAFMRAAGSSNHHDLGFLAIGSRAVDPPKHAVGLFHLAWQVQTIEDLAATRATLIERKALTGESDHGATKSVYGLDPDGNEFEVMWMVPRALWGEYESTAVSGPLDLDAELERFGAKR